VPSGSPAEFRCLLDVTHVCEQARAQIFLLEGGRGETDPEAIRNLCLILKAML
jgi:hypothetical protein